MDERRFAAAARLTPLLRRVHIWVGLLSLTSLLVMGTSGLVSALHTAPAPHAHETFDYRPPPDASDVAVARDLIDRLQPGLTHRPPDWAIGRTPDGRVRFDLEGPNTVVHVVVDEAAGRVEVTRERRDIGQMLTYLHQQSSYSAIPDVRMRAWGLYVDLSIVALGYLATSGIWLWLTGRQTLRWARFAFALGVAAFTGVAALLF